MKKLESSLLNMALVLTGVAVVMGGILAFVRYQGRHGVQRLGCCQHRRGHSER